MLSSSSVIDGLGFSSPEMDIPSALIIGTARDTPQGIFPPTYTARRRYKTKHHRYCSACCLSCLDEMKGDTLGQKWSTSGCSHKVALICHLSLLDRRKKKPVTVDWPVIAFQRQPLPCCDVRLVSNQKRLRWCLRAPSRAMRRECVSGMRCAVPRCPDL